VGLGLKLIAKGYAAPLLGSRPELSGRDRSGPADRTVAADLLERLGHSGWGRVGPLGCQSPTVARRQLLPLKRHALINTPSRPGLAPLPAWRGLCDSARSCIFRCRLRATEQRGRGLHQHAEEMKGPGDTHRSPLWIMSRVRDRRASQACVGVRGGITGKWEAEQGGPPRRMACAPFSGLAGNRVVPHFMAFFP